MKKILFVILFFTGMTATHAQSERTFRAFKIDLSAGYAFAMGDTSTNGGVLFSFEPKYAINDFVTIGLRTEITISITGNANNANVKGTGSYLLTGDYYFTTSTFRPFAGAGVGIYRHASADVGTTEVIKAITQFGYAPRVGFEAGHFRLAVEYNFAGKAVTVKKNYLGIKLGILFGGGRFEN